MKLKAKLIAAPLGSALVALAAGAGYGVWSHLDRDAERSAQALAGLGGAHHFVLEAYKHGKAVCALGQGAALLRLLGLDAQADAKALARHPGVVLGRGTAETAPDTAKAFIEAIGRHRHWDRPLAEAVPA
mgnify:CR=1 FL=1